MARVPFGRRAGANRGPVPNAATSPSLDDVFDDNPSRSKKVPKEAVPAGRGKKRSVPEVFADPSKKLKAVMVEEPSNTVSSTFGSIAAEYYTEGDAEKLRNRSLADAKSIFISSLGEAFYHGLETFTHHTKIIQDQDKLITKLKGENHAATAKLEVLSKKSEEGVKAKDAEIAKLKATLEAERKEHAAAIDSLKAEAFQARSDLEVELQKQRDDLYAEGFLDYLANFLAVDPDYSWKGFPPSTPNFVANFKVEHGKEIEASKEVIRLQIESELAELAKTKGGEASTSNAGDVGGGEIGGGEIGWGDPVVDNAP